MRLIEKVQRALADFAEQSEATVMIVRSHDEELLPVVRCLEGIDGAPHFVYLDLNPVSGTLVDYVDILIAMVLERMDTLRAEEAPDDPTLPEPSDACWSHRVDPLVRLRMTFAHFASWLPEDDETHLVIAILPSEIKDPHVHARVVQALLPQSGFEPWMARVRFVLRDDKANSFLTQSALNARSPGVVLFETSLTQGDIIGELIEDASNPELLPGQRVQALMQCAMVEVSLGMLTEAMAKLRSLYAYYTQYNVPEMRGVVLLQVAEAFRRANAPERAHHAIMAALDIATSHSDLTLMTNSSHALALHSAGQANYLEAEMACAVGCVSARALHQDDLHAEFLLRRGDARAAQGNWAGALEMWTTCANETRDKGNYNMLSDALGRLHDYASRTGHRDIAAGYAAEIQECRVITGGAG
ncbi:hypothetical protein LZC95_15455 [Pendulispora brunnea]|uniref:Uncharacterized protein n=1 Tax=Pendulispora brunnea TaxID=2905690 RepID=A0ABZ2KPG4_9BACT